MLKIKGFLPTSLIDWEGKLASCIFIGGCNFKCPWCHASKFVLQVTTGPTYDIDKILKSLEPKKAWLDGIVIGGGEPTMHDDLPIVLKKIKKAGYLVKVDTNGSFPEMLRNLIRSKLVDYIAMDIKAPLNTIKYSEVIGKVVDINKIKESILLLIRSRSIDYEFRTTVVPVLLSKDDILKIASFIKKAKRYFLQQFRPIDCIEKRFLSVKPYSNAELKMIAEAASCYLPTQVRL